MTAPADGDGMHRLEDGAPCRFCARMSYLADRDGPAHRCCRVWQTVIAAGHQCPACHAAAWMQDPATRYLPLPPLPRRTRDGRPYMPDASLGAWACKPCGKHLPGGRCGATPARPYPAGWRCDDHIPTPIADEPGPPGSTSGILRVVDDSGATRPAARRRPRAA